MIDITRSNIILYCDKWHETVDFYQSKLNLPVLNALEWFVEFRLNEQSCLSIADASKASIMSSQGHGITVTMKVDDIESVYTNLVNAGLKPTAIQSHAWGGLVIYVFDPEGHRLEFWSL